MTERSRNGRNPAEEVRTETVPVNLVYHSMAVTVSLEPIGLTLFEGEDDAIR